MVLPATSRPTDPTASASSTATAAPTAMMGQTEVVIPQYHCRYRLPTPDAVLAAQRALAANDAALKPNPRLAAILNRKLYMFISVFKRSNIDALEANDS